MAFFSYNSANLISIVRSMLQEDAEGEHGYFFTDAMLINYINDAISVIAERTGAYRTVDNVSTTPAQRLISYNGYKCISVEYNQRALIKIMPSQIGHVPLNGTHPQYWFERGNYIGIEPIPDSVYSIYPWYLPYVTAIGGGSSVLPYTINNLIIWYVLSKAYEQDRMIAASNECLSIFNKELEYIINGLMPYMPRGDVNG